jgi:CheY-like chemotaxis protein
MSAKAAVDRSRLVVLIAEDDPNDVLLLKRAFAKACIPALLFFVSDGQEAISYLRGEPPFSNRAAHPFPNVLLLDLNMPLVGGLEVLEWLASWPDRTNLRVVVFSSCVAPADSRQASSLGAHSCITKPLAPSDLDPLLRDLPGYPEADVSP